VTIGNVAHPSRADELGEHSAGIGPHNADVTIHIRANGLDADPRRGADMNDSRIEATP
jgi:hypothetical protein